MPHRPGGAFHRFPDISDFSTPMKSRTLRSSPQSISSTVRGPSQAIGRGPIVSTTMSSVAFYSSFTLRGRDRVSDEAHRTVIEGSPLRLRSESRVPPELLRFLTPHRLAALPESLYAHCHPGPMRDLGKSVYGCYLDKSFFIPRLTQPFHSNLHLPKNHHL